MKRLLLTLLCAGSFAMASSITWDFSDVAFTDGGTASGYFTVDRSGGGSQNITSFDLVTTAGSALAAFEYTPENSVGVLASSTEILIYTKVELPIGNRRARRQIDLFFSSSLLTARGSADVEGDQSYECFNCSPYRLVASGSVIEADQPAPTPEPQSTALLAPLFVAFAGRRFWKLRIRPILSAPSN